MVERVERRVLALAGAALAGPPLTDLALDPLLVCWVECLGLPHVERP